MYLVRWGPNVHFVMFLSWTEMAVSKRTLKMQSKWSNKTCILQIISKRVILRQTIGESACLNFPYHFEAISGTFNKYVHCNTICELNRELKLMMNLSYSL